MWCHGYIIGPGTLYPILHKLQKNGYLRSEKIVESGRIRVNYRTTSRGRSALRNIRPKIGELVSEVLADK